MTRQQPIVWNPSFAIGVDEIDEQHASMFDRIEALLTACEDGHGEEEIARSLRFLDEYVRKHFLDEETYCEAIGFPDALEHKQMHQDYVDELAKIKARYEEEGASALLAVEINRYLVNWLVNHITVEDVKIARFGRS